MIRKIISVLTVLLITCGVALAVQTGINFNETVPGNLDVVGEITSLNGVTNSPNADQTVHVRSVADFPTAVANVITLEADTKYIIDKSFSMSERFVIPEGSFTEMESAYADEIFLDYTGSDTFFTGTNVGFVTFYNVTFTNSSGNGTLYNFSGVQATTLIEHRKGTVQGWASLGTISNVNVASFQTVGVFDITDGLTLENVNLIPFVTSFWEDSVDNSGTFLYITGSSVATSASIHNTIANTQPNESIFYIDPAIHEDSEININLSIDSGDGEPFKIGDTGSITVFADAGGGQVTVTSAGHGLSNGDSVLITKTTNYDGGYVISNVTTDTFEITATWVADDATGTWDSGSLDGKDVRMNVQDVSGAKDSQNIGSFFINNNAEPTAITVQGDWYDLDLNDSAAESSNIERWKMTDPNNGELTYLGRETFSGQLFVNMSASSAGATQEFHWRVVVNGSPTSDAIVSARSTAGSTGNTTLIAPIVVDTNDVVKVQVSNSEGTSNIIMRFVSVIIQ
jgi:hypothetical protein